MTPHNRFTMLVGIAMTVILAGSIFAASTSVLYLNQVKYERAR